MCDELEECSRDMNPIMDSLSVPPPPLDNENVDHAPPKVCVMCEKYNKQLNGLCLMFKQMPLTCYFLDRQLGLISLLVVVSPLL